MHHTKTEAHKMRRAYRKALSSGRWQEAKRLRVTAFRHCNGLDTKTLQPASHKDGRSVNPTCATTTTTQF